jgi:hypothetical protein
MSTQKHCEQAGSLLGLDGGCWEGGLWDCEGLTHLLLKAVQDMIRAIGPLQRGQPNSLGDAITLWDRKEESVGQMSDEIHRPLGSAFGTTKQNVIGAETTGKGDRSINRRHAWLT